MREDDYHYIYHVFFMMMIPLNRPEYKYMKENHISYMKNIYTADHIHCISNYSMKRLISFFHDYRQEDMSETKIDVIHLACENIKVNDASFLFFKKYLKISEPYILSVGSITTHKNQLNLVKAFIDFKFNNECVLNLVLIGSVSNNLKDSLYSLICKRNDIFVLEGVNSQELAGAYENCLFTVFPSIEEGFGLPILESLYYDKICVTSMYGAMSEVAEYGGCLMVDTTSVDQIIKGIYKLIFNKKIFKKLQLEASQVEVPSWHNYTSTLVKKWLDTKDNLLFDDSSNKKRIFWLGMHKILVKTELTRLRDLGYEVFKPTLSF